MVAVLTAAGCEAGSGRYATTGEAVGGGGGFGGPQAVVSAGRADTRPTSWTETRLYFGLSSPSGPISEKEFDAFLDTAVTPRFPDGYTVLHARGAWRDAGATSTSYEESRVLVLIHPATASDDAKIQAIRQEYKQRYNQQSVLRSDVAARADF